MTLIVNCTKCGKELRSQDRYAGKPVRCSQCGTINKLPNQPSAAPARILQSAFCFVCGKDFAADPDLVRDTKGRSYHRRCYLEASRYEKSRREEEVRRQQSGSLPASGAQSAGRRATPEAPLDDDLMELVEIATPSADPWAELSQPASDPFGGQSLGGYGGRKDGVWLYVLIGFGAAVPIVVLLFIIVQLIISSVQGPAQPNAANTPPAAAAEQTPPQESTSPPKQSSPSSTTPVPPPATTPATVPPISETPQTPAEPENPFTPENAATPQETRAQPDALAEFAPPAMPSPPDSGLESAGDRDSVSSPARRAFTAGVGAGMLLAIAAFGLVFVFVGAVLLRVSCSICNEIQPSFGAGMFVSFLIFIANSLISFLLQAVMGQALGGTVALPIVLLVDGAIISATLSLSFGKGILIALANFILLVAIAVALTTVLFLLVMLRNAAR